jgi:hypothetical protein
MFMLRVQAFLATEALSCQLLLLYTIISCMVDSGHGNSSIQCLRTMTQRVTGASTPLDLMLSYLREASGLPAADCDHILDSALVVLLHLPNLVLCVRVITPFFYLFSIQTGALIRLSQRHQQSRESDTVLAIVVILNSLGVD